MHANSYFSFHFKFTLKPELAKAILANKKSSIPPLFKALSAEFDERLILGEVKSTDKDNIETLGIKDFPAVVLYPANSDKPIVYDGI